MRNAETKIDDSDNSHGHARWQGHALGDGRAWEPRTAMDEVTTTRSNMAQPSGEGERKRERMCACVHACVRACVCMRERGFRNGQWKGIQGDGELRERGRGRGYFGW